MNVADVSLFSSILPLIRVDMGSFPLFFSVQKLMYPRRTKNGYSTSSHVPHIFLSHFVKEYETVHAVGKRKCARERKNLQTGVNLQHTTTQSAFQ